MVTFVCNSQKKAGTRRKRQALPRHSNTGQRTLPGTYRPVAAKARHSQKGPPRRPCRQRRLAGRPGDGTQPGTLDSAHRSGRAGGNHQDPATTLVLYSRSAHPLGAPPHFTSSPALALGNPVQSRLGTIACPSISGLTAPLAPDQPSRLLNRLEGYRQVGPRASLAACSPHDLAHHRQCGPSTSPLRGYLTLHTAKSIGIKPSRHFPLPLIPSLTKWLHAFGGSGLTSMSRWP